MARADKGFTLIELITAASLSFVVVSSLFYFLLPLLGWQRSAHNMENGLHSCLSAIQTMSAEIRSSKGVSSLSTKDRLIITFDTYTISFDLAAGKVRRTKGATSQYLTADGSITGLQFFYPAPHRVILNLQPSFLRYSLTSEACCRNE
ncbi:MAG: hypothetical protein NTZ10_05175 [Candidatus Saganbacteria bacterium]|nr:hypothetical protein [Candidatus Saganbacteria bacterium]